MATGSFSAGATVVGYSLTVTTANYLQASLPVVTGYFHAVGIEAALPALRASMSGTVGTGAQLSASTPRLTASFSGNAGGLSTRVPSLAAAFSGTVGQFVSLTPSLPRLTAAFAASSGLQTALALQLRPPTVAFAGTVGVVGAVSASIKLSASFAGTTGKLAVLSAKTPALRGSFSAGQGITATMAARLPRLLAQLHGDIPRTQIDTLVVATATMTTVRYAAYPYNSFAAFGGKYLAAGPGGLFQIDAGADDAGTQIDAYVETGLMDFNNPQIKRMSDVYLSGRSELPVKVTLEADEKPVGSYTVAPLSVQTLRQRRGLVGKGGRGRYWKARIENTGGGALEIDDVHFEAAITARRI